MNGIRIKDREGGREGNMEGGEGDREEDVEG